MISCLQIDWRKALVAKWFAIPFNWRLAFFAALGINVLVFFFDIVQFPLGDHDVGYVDGIPLLSGGGQAAGSPRFYIFYPGMFKSLSGRNLSLFAVRLWQVWGQFCYGIRKPGHGSFLPVPLLSPVCLQLPISIIINRAVKPLPLGGGYKAHLDWNFSFNIA